MGSLGGEAPGRGLGLQATNWDCTDPPVCPLPLCWRGKGCPPTECSGSTFRHQDGKREDGLSFHRAAGD